jgi:4-amino-4-deoxy-L-arabinose transferase-like glycosyltransferase
MRSGYAQPRRQNGVPKVAARLKQDRLVWVVLSITLCGALLRFATLRQQSYWYDEAVTVGLMRSSLRAMLRALPGTESTPPLYYVSAWLWSKIFGTDEMGLRSFSALVGTLAIPAGYAAGRELVSRRAAVLAATLVATSPFLIWYSQEARAYSLFVLLSALSLVFFGRAWTRGTRRALIWWAIFASLSIWTEYFAIFLVGPEALLLAARPATRRAALRAIAVVALAAGAVLPLAYRQSHNGHNMWIADIPLHDRAYNAATWFIVGPYFIAHVWWIAAAIAAVGFLSVAFLATRAERRGAALAASLAAGCLLLPLISARGGRNYWLFRNLIAAWIPLAIALAAGLGTRRPTSALLRGCLAALAVASVTVSAFLAVRLVSGQGYERQNWRGLAHCLGARQSGRALVVFPSYQEAALRLYRPSVQRLQRQGASLVQIDLVGGMPPTFRRPSGFRRAGYRCSNSISVVRYRASKPRQLQPHQIVAPRPREPDAGVVVVDAG